MSTLTKKDWLNLTANAALEIENMKADLQIGFRKLHNEVDDMERSVDWDWDTYTDADGHNKAVYWDGATEEECAMLDYHAKFSDAWDEVLEEINKAVAAMEHACEQLNKLRIEEE